MTTATPPGAARRTLLGVTYEHPTAFWLGVGAVIVGTLMQLPMYFHAADMGYHLHGMPIDPTMASGMVLMIGGVLLTGYGLFPRLSRVRHASAARISVRALDDAALTWAHVGLILVMAAAITIDVMKPTTLAFIAPGAASEYGLRSALNPDGNGLPIALYPLSGISGTVVGSFVWGWLGDRVGRRGSILIAAVMFIGTSTCGSMPEYWINLLTCFLMGLGVGGMLPIIFSLVSETVPARHRGWIIVLIGGDVAGAYIIMSWLASTIGSPESFGWRSLWLIGIPTSVLLVLLNRLIPESPRFLIEQGRDDEARAVMARYGAAALELDPDDRGRPAAVEHGHGHYGVLFAKPLTGLTLVLVLLSVGIGIVQYGFQQWIPSNLQTLGYSEVNASALLRDSALIGFPLNFPIAFLYGLWSSRKTIILMASLTAAALIGFVVAGDGVTGNAVLLQGLLIAPIWGISSLTAVTAAYASEIYPTHIRARGTGLAAGGTKLGGVLVLAAVAAAVAAPSISVTALLGALPLAGAVIAIVLFGIETRTRSLEEITAEEFSATGPRALHAGAGTARHAEAPADEGRRTDREGTMTTDAPDRIIDYLVLGAGPAGLQLAWFLHTAGRDYAVLEAGSAPGTFFTTFPRHRTLISINKPHTGTDDPELNLRQDWNSLLSDDPSLLFTAYSPRYFPHADDLVRYLADFAAATGLRIRYGTRIERIDRDGDFVLTDQSGRTYRARRLIMATGLTKPYVPPIPGIETAERYWDVSVDPGDFTDQRVLIIGKGNSAFETADNLVETAAVVHVAGPSSVRLAWRTHYVGHVRAVNNNFLDTYQLKSQNAILDGDVLRIERGDDGRYVVSFRFVRADEVVKDIAYDRVIACTGFRFDADVFAPGCRPDLVIRDRFPAQTSAWGSPNVEDLYFAGTVMQVRDFKKSTGGFIHGFRYCVRALHRILERRYHGTDWPSRALAPEPAALMEAVIERVNRTSALWQQFGFLADVIVVPDEGDARYLEEMPLDHACEQHVGSDDRWFSVTLEYGDDHDLVDPFDITVARAGQTDAERAAEGRYLHPVVRAFRGDEVVAIHHVTENLENEWDGRHHREPLEAFFAQQLGDRPVAAPA